MTKNSTSIVGKLSLSANRVPKSFSQEAFYFVVRAVLSKGVIGAVMHQSIPTAPCPPPLGNCRAFAHLVSPWDGALANLARPGGRAFANPRDNPGKFVDVFKGMFS